MSIGKVAKSSLEAALASSRISMALRRSGEKPARGVITSSSEQGSASRTLEKRSVEDKPKPSSSPGAYVVRTPGMEEGAKKLAPISIRDKLTGKTTSIMAYKDEKSPSEWETSGLKIEPVSQQRRATLPFDDIDDDGNIVKDKQSIEVDYEEPAVERQVSIDYQEPPKRGKAEVKFDFEDDGDPTTSTKAQVTTTKISSVEVDDEDSTAVTKKTKPKVSAPDTSQKATVEFEDEDEEAVPISSTKAKVATAKTRRVEVDDEDVDTKTKKKTKVHATPSAKVEEVEEEEEVEAAATKDKTTKTKTGPGMPVPHVPGEILPNPGESKIADFYLGRIPDPHGRFIKDIHAYEGTNKMETVHHYIQALFPSEKSSNNNTEAFLLTQDDVKAFKNSKLLRDAMYKSLNMMLTHWGLKMSRLSVEPQHGKTSFFWTKPGNHNHLRMTRTIEAVALMIDQRLAVSLSQCLIDIAKKHGGVSDKTLRYWKNAPHVKPPRS